MAHIVTDKCIKCKYTDCIEVCPVDCFYEGDLMVVINPEECIDCGVCIPECPVNAIVDGNDLIQDNKVDFAEVNKSYSKIWPKITRQKPALFEAELHREEENKYEKYFLLDVSSK